MRRDVIDRGHVVVAKRREVRLPGEDAAIGRERGKGHAPRQQVRKLLQQAAIVRPRNGSFDLWFRVRLNRARPWKRHAGKGRDGKRRAGKRSGSDIRRLWILDDRFWFL